MKKKIILILVFLSILFLGIKAFAKTIYDMQKINISVNKPKSNFKVEYVDEKGEIKEAYANSSFYDSSLNNFDLSSNTITVLQGTKVKVIDESESGDGNKISRYDFQIYTPSDSELINTQSKTEVEKEIILNEVGRYDLYLSVMDDYKNIQGFDNWSVNGNHRWLGENKKNKDQMFYWYFSQLTINVVSEINDDEFQEELIEEHDEENHSPEVEIIAPDIFYPNEILDNKKITNNVSWMYFDEDKDEMKVSRYQLYKIENGKKILIDEKDSITKRKDMNVDIRGEMNDKYELDVYVEDCEGKSASDRLIMIINEIKPKVLIDMYDRCYLFDEIEPKLYLLKDGINEYLNVTYEKYYIVDSQNNEIVSGAGKVDTIKVNERFVENETYTLVQKYKNSYGSSYDVSKSFYVVEVEPPIVMIDNVSLYYGDECEMKVNVFQPQSRLKGELPNYNYTFEDNDARYEIRLNDKKIYEGIGIIKNFCANEKMNVKEIEEDTNYKVYQYVKNGRKKEGLGIANVLVKKINDSYVDVEIMERDDDPLTIKNEIYKNESLDIKTNFYVKKNEEIIEKGSYILDQNDNKYYEQNNFYNELKQIKLDEGYYKIVCFLKTKENKYEDSEEFVVKKMAVPVIEKINMPNYKITKLDMFDLKFKTYDVNKSEEHPHGFELINCYQIDDKKHEGIFTELNIQQLKSDNEYEITQYSTNKEHLDVNNVDKVDFYLENILPQLKFEGKDEYYAGENVELTIEGSDEDGFIKQFDTIVESNLITDLKMYDEKVDEHKVVKHISFKCVREGNLDINASIIDDANACVDNIFTLKINDALFYPYIELLTSEEKRLKENRYLKIKYGATNNACPILILDGFEIKFNENVFENEYMKMLIENDEKDKVAGLYFKKKGTYKLEVQAIKDGIKSNTRNITFVIKEDLAPVISLTCDDVVYRDESTNIAKSKLYYDIQTDDEIDILACYIDNNKTEFKNDYVYFGYNELGYKPVYIKVKETNDCMPDQTHPFYIELLEKQKQSMSNICLIKIENRTPCVEYNGVSNKYKINIIE